MATIKWVRKHSVQAEHENFSDPTFLDAFDLSFHMPGHFLL